MTDITILLKKAIEEINLSGLPSRTEEANRFITGLLIVSLEEILKLRSCDNEKDSGVDLDYLDRYLFELKRNNYLSNIVSDSSEISALISGGDKKTMSRKMFRAAQTLTIGHTQSWLELCRDAEHKYKSTMGGKLPRSYTQTKSNIKRMMLASIDLNEFDNESDARAFLLYGKKT